MFVSLLLRQPTNDLSSGKANFNGNYPFGKAPKGPYCSGQRGWGPIPRTSWAYATCTVTYGNGAEDLSKGPDRVIRGGSWDIHGSDCQAAYRGGSAPRTGQQPRLPTCPSSPSGSQRSISDKFGAPVVGWARLLPSFSHLVPAISSFLAPRGSEGVADCPVPLRKSLYGSTVTLLGRLPQQPSDAAAWEQFVFSPLPEYRERGRTVERSTVKCWRRHPSASACVSSRAAGRRPADSADGSANSGSTRRTRL